MKIMKIKILLVVLVMLGVQVNAQNDLQKIGYTSTEYILSLLPVAKQIERDLRDYNDQLASQLQAKEQTFQTKLSDYQRNGGTMTDLVRKDAERELQSMNAGLEQFKQDAQNSLMQKQQQLLNPVLEDIRVAIEEVANEHQFTHIINTSSSGVDILLFAKPEYDISNLVLAKLGVDPPAENN